MKAYEIKNGIKEMLNVPKGEPRTITVQIYDESQTFDDNGNVIEQTSEKYKMFFTDELRKPIKINEN